VKLTTDSINEMNEITISELKYKNRIIKVYYSSSTIYWCNIGPIYSQCLANENIFKIIYYNGMFVTLILSDHFLIVYSHFRLNNEFE